MVEYPHLHLRDMGVASKKFRAKPSRSKPEPAPRRNRPRHAQNLSAQLSAVASYLSDITHRQKAAGVENKRRGVALTAFGREGEEIRVGTTKLRTRGLELLSLKRTPGKPDIANFFVTKANIKSLEKSIGDYATYESGDKPRRFRLFETIDNFTVSEVEYLWTDEDDKFPGSDIEFDWEVWVRLENTRLFERCCERLEIAIAGRPTEFVDTAIYNVLATREELETLIEESASVVELRSASSFATEYGDFDPEERMDTLTVLMDRVEEPDADSPLTTIFDTGVNYANPLVGIALDPDDCTAVDEDWPTNDHCGHGTHMAGIALYGDLEAKLTDTLPIQLETALESIVVSAPDGAAVAHAHDTLQAALDSIPDDGRARVLCLAQTAPRDLATGRQTTLSGVVDRAAWNGGDSGRLFCVAAGNVQGTVSKGFARDAYDNRNADHRIESPGQAVNALTVGAATHKCSEDWEGVAGEGDLCPSARTSQGWDIHYAYKPDIVMEGGNQAIVDDGPFSYQQNETMLLTAGRNYPSQPFAFTGETSAATAHAAGLATRLLARYPDFWAETLRGLMVHSADWTPAMLARLMELKKTLSKQNALHQMMRCYGWGTPNEERLFRSANDALTLIVEDSFNPYQVIDGKVSLKEMKYFKLPWPAEILKNQLRHETVQLRCTLSYFVEPDPHAASRSRRERYPSHGLRFVMKLPGDSDLETMQKVNEYADEEDVEYLEDSASFGVSEKDQGWTLGDRFRRRGTIHHDLWEGKGYQLAERDGIAVYPVRGWWGDRKDAKYQKRKTRFSLIVSVRTPGQQVDLVAAAMAEIRARNLSLVRSIPITSS